MKPSPKYEKLTCSIPFPQTFWRKILVVILTLFGRKICGNPRVMVEMIAETEKRIIEVLDS